MTETYHKYSSLRLLMLTWIALAYGFSNISYSSNTSFALPKISPKITYEPSGITQVESRTDLALLRSSGPALWSTGITESFGTASNTSTKKNEASHTSLHSSVGLLNATQANSDAGEIFRPESHATESSAYRYNQTASPNLIVTQQATFGSVYNTSQSSVASLRYTNRTENSTTTGIDTRNQNISSTSFDSWSQCVKSTYATDFPVIYRTSSPECDMQISVDDLKRDPWRYYDYVDRCLARWCWTSWLSAMDAVTRPIEGSWTSVYSWVDITSELISKTILTASNEDPVYWNYTWGDVHTTTLITSNNEMDVVTISKPCCGHCTIDVHNLNLYYWPDQGVRNVSVAVSRATAGAQSSSSYIDESGFTFVSPSVYIAFTSLLATDSCGQVGSHPTTYTMAFDAHEITTLKYSGYEYEAMPICPNGARVYSKTISRVMTWADLQSGCETFTFGMPYHPIFPFGWAFPDNPCRPHIAIPTKVIELHPEWASCRPHRSGGLYDPPKTLHPGAVLVPTAVTALTSTFPSATPRSMSRLPLMTAASQARPTLPGTQAGAMPSLTSQESRSPMATLDFPPPIFVQPDQGPIVFEPVQPPRLDTLVIPLPVPRPEFIQPPVLASMSAQPHQVQDAALTSKSDLPVITFDNGVVTANTAGQFIIGSQTLIPGGAVTIKFATISMESAGSYVVINATSTISVGRTIQMPSSYPADAEDKVMLVFGGSTMTQPNGQLSIIGGTTTIVPAHSEADKSSPYTLMIAGIASTLSDGRVTVIGGSITVAPAIIAYHSTIITLTIGAKTSTLPNGAVAVHGGKMTVVKAAILPNAKSLTLIYGGKTMTLSDGRRSVVGGTQTVVAVPKATAEARTSTTTIAAVDILGNERRLSLYRKPTFQRFGGDEQGTGNAKTTSLKSGCVRLGTDWLDLLLLCSAFFVLKGVW